MAEKLYCDDPKKILSEIESLRTESSNIIYKSKHDLLSIYLINYVLYNEMPQIEKKESPVYDMLIKTSILLEKICEMEDKVEIIIKEHDTKAHGTESKNANKIVDGVDRRLVSDEILRNKKITERNEKNNPRKKFKTKSENMKERIKIKERRDIDN